MSAREHPASRRTLLRVEGMTCGNCARKVGDVVRGFPEVRGVSVTVETGRASVHWAGDAAAALPSVLTALERAGYPAEVLPGDALEADGFSPWRLNLFVGVAGTVPLLLGEWALGWSKEPWFHWVAFVLASAVQCIAGTPFYRGAWRQLKAGASSMDTLVALGSTTAYGFSVWLLFSGRGEHLFFAESASILTLISLGHWLEARAGAQASAALKSLLQLAPERALKLDAQGKEIEVPVASLQAGDAVVLKPGSRVPVDGTVTEGGSAVDESMLTGESLPVDKAPGSPLFAGTVNQDGRLVLRVTATGEATALAAIIAAVERAQGSRAGIQRLADRVSNIFVPIVVGIAVAVGLWWGLAPASAAAVHDALAGFLWHAHLPETPLARAILIAAAVLIVACPCAMGLATPAAIMAGSNAAARRGILIRDGIALEKAGQVSAVLLDKTGTLTTGKPSVAATWNPAGGSVHANAPALLALSASLARPSQHPLSLAVAALDGARVPLEEWREVRGQGVQAMFRRVEEGSPDDAPPPTEVRVRLGSLRWLADLGTDVAPVEAFAAEWSARGASVLGVVFDGRLLGGFAVQDALKPGAKAVIARLQAQGLKTFLVSGDNPAAAREVARLTGIPAAQVFAEVRPEQKAGIVRQLQERGERVAFVGDGINDAPALEQADLGVAVSRASDVAREAADVILLKSEIEAVPEALGLARATLRTIRQNLFWAFFYNAAAIPLAALGFISPVLCAAAMGFSDLIVIGNALRLRRWRP